MKIVIVGGGTAGWITAAFFIKHTIGHDITVIESSKIGIIGAGEGSTGTLPWFIKGDGFPWPDNQVNELDFLRKTKATLKLGINMENWKGDGSSYYSPFQGSPTDTLPTDTAFLGSILKYGRSDMSSLHSWMLKDKLSTFAKIDGRIKNVLNNHSYHFDGHEVGKYFKELCISKGVKLIDSEVDSTTFDEREYLQSITISNGDVLSADLWFDCSGFNRVLMSNTKNKWISYEDNLPTNCAIPFSDNISSKSVKFQTDAIAMNAGWMWRIPLQNRYGCGYVYCDKFQTYEQSISEVETKLGYKIEPIKHIKFKPGRYENTWYNNIVSIGLSSHFLEPLQATSIHISLISLSNLLLHHLKSKESISFELDRCNYNSEVNVMIDDYKDFIQMHYLTGRKDTPFWKFVTNEMIVTDKNKEYLEISKYRLLNMFDVERKHGTPGWPLWCHIMYNAGLFKNEDIINELKYHHKLNDSEEQIKKMIMHYNKFKQSLVPTDEFFKYLKI